MTTRSSTTAPEIRKNFLQVYTSKANVLCQLADRRMAENQQMRDKAGRGSRHPRSENPDLGYPAKSSPEYEYATV
jgi:hypothetical protein